MRSAREINLILKNIVSIPAAKQITNNNSGVVSHYYIATFIEE